MRLISVLALLVVGAQERLQLVQIQKALVIHRQPDQGNAGDRAPRQLVRVVFEERVEDDRFAPRLGFVAQAFGHQIDGFRGVGSEDHVVVCRRRAQHIGADGPDLPDDLLLYLAGPAPCLADRVPDRREGGRAGGVVQVDEGSRAFRCWNTHTATDQGLPEFIATALARSISQDRRGTGFRRRPVVRRSPASRRRRPGKRHCRTAGSAATPRQTR